MSVYGLNSKGEEILEVTSTSLNDLSCSPDLWTPWQSEIEADNIEKLALKAVLQKVLRRRRLEEFSALTAAAKDGDVDMVRTLLMRGADINMVDYDGRSALAVVSGKH